MTRQRHIPKRAKPGEQGYALLIVFLMAAAVAMSLYKEMPRIAFESMRNREQMLMDRGNQYTRAIQVFYQVNKRYPARLEDLERTNEIRFLRRRYKDPMNGSEEWRLVHTNGSSLTDSLVEKPPEQNAQGGSQSQLPGSGPLGTNNLNTAAPAQPNPNDPNANTVNPAVMQRATDRRQPGAFMNGAELANGFVNPSQANGQPNFAGQAFDPNNPSTWPSITLGPLGANGQVGPNGTIGQFPNQQPGLQMIEGQRNDGAGVFAGNRNGLGVPNGVPGAVPAGVVPSQPGFNQQQGSNQQGTPLPGFAFPGTNGSPQGFTPQQGTPQQIPSLQITPQPFPQGGQGNSPFGSGVSNPALDQINRQLLQPGAPQQNFGGNAGLGAAGNVPSGGNNARGGFGNNAPGGFPGQSVGGLGGQAGGITGAAGIAGVASRYEGPTIKAFHEREKYQEWEFVYKPAVNQAGAGAGQVGGGLGGQGGSGQGVGGAGGPGGGGLGGSFGGQGGGRNGNGPGGPFPQNGNPGGGPPGFPGGGPNGGGFNQGGSNNQGGFNNGGSNQGANSNGFPPIALPSNNTPQPGQKVGGRGR